MTADPYPRAHTSVSPGAEADRAVAGDPVDEAQAVRNAIRRTARGMAHHEAEEELERARSADTGGDDGGKDGGEDGPVGPAVEEWERIVDLLTTHAGPYDPDTDPFVQGELTAQANQAAARQTEDGGAAATGTDERAAQDALSRALARTGVRDGAGAENESVVTRIVRADPAAALAVSRWLDDAFAAGRARTED